MDGPVLPKKQKRKPRLARKLDQRFNDYIWFGFQSTVCLGIFALCYALVLIALWPLLTANSPSEMTNEQLPPPPGSHGLRLPSVLKEVALHDKEVVSEIAGVVKERLNKLRQGRGVTDAALMDQAKLEFEELRKKKQDEAKQAVAVTEQRKQHADSVAVAGNEMRRGVMVLGMHRSGTSMMSGLLVTSCGYHVGDHLIHSAADNEKGFFERVDIVLQNDEFMRKQHVNWAANVINYHWEQALKDKEDGTADFQQYGKPGLEFLNNPGNTPWLQKDPRMCITLKTWLKLMNNEPAIVFTYRHPLEVARSLKRREPSFSLEQGLRLWIVYNMRAIQNSKGLCIVYTSNDAILADPMHEVQRISDELTTRCNVHEPPYKLKQEDVDKFVDPSLQHTKKQRKDEENEEILATYNDGKCVVHAYKSETEEGSLERKRETVLYSWAMKMYCDFQSGKAYEDSYVWPELQ